MKESNIIKEKRRKKNSLEKEHYKKKGKGKLFVNRVIVVS